MRSQTVKRLDGREENAAAVTVLLVDDQPIWRGSVRSMLDDTEFEVVGEAGTRKEALETAHRVCPQLTLMNIRMANGNQFQTLSRLKQEHPHMDVVMLAPYDSPSLVAQAIARGATGYLVKGIDREHLLATLRSASRHRRHAL